MQSMAFLAEQAGGKASNGKERILDIEPKELHQRMPFFVGTKSMVEQAEALYGAISRRRIIHSFSTNIDKPDFLFVRFFIFENSTFSLFAAYFTSERNMFGKKRY